MSTSPAIQCQNTSTPEISIRPEACLALDRCMAAWDAIYLPEMAKGASHVLAAYSAAPAYRAAMPTLTTPHDIRDFIACTTRGLVLGAIEESLGAKLLYAAQVASGYFHRQDRQDRKEKTPPAL